jgi:hypothetical protein
VRVQNLEITQDAGDTPAGLALAQPRALPLPMATDKIAARCATAQLDSLAYRSFLLRSFARRFFFRLARPRDYHNPTYSGSASTKG